MRTVPVSIRQLPGLLVALTVLSLVGSFILGGGKAAAVTSWAPDAADYTDGGGVYLDVSDAGPANGLNAPASAVTIYSYSPNPTVSIWNPDHCSGGTYDSTAPGAIPWDTTFVFGGAAQVYPNGSGPGGTNSISSSASGCDSHVWSTTLSGLSSINIGGTTFYVATLNAQILAGTGGVNAFKVSTDSGYVSFKTPDKRFALQNRAGSRSQGSYSYGDFYIKFGVDCSVTAPYNTDLISFDDDQGDGAQDNGAPYSSPIWYDLIEFDPNGNPTGNNVSDSLGGYGNSRTVAHTVTLRPYHTYQWIWHNVSSGNGIQFQMPANTDQIYSVAKCQQPWSLSATASANATNLFPGQTVRFSYDLHNNGPGTANFQYVTRVQAYLGTVPQPVDSWPTPNAYEPALPGGASEPSYSIRDYTVPYNAALTKVCSWIEYAGQSNTNGSPASSNQVCVTVTQPTPTCNGATVTPSSGIDPTTAFVVTASVKYQSQPAAASAYGSGTRLYATVTGPGGYNQDSLNSMDLGPPAAADLTANSRVFPATGNTGIYTVTYGARGGIGTINTCTITFQVGYYPFFRVEGADAVAGAGIADTSGSCTADNTAFIRGSNKGSSGNYFGSGAQLGAIALSTIGASVAFPTSTNKDGTVSGVASGNRTGLTFANTSTPGGNFGALPCVKDYAGVAATTAGATTSGGGSVSPASLADGTYIYTGSVTLNGGTIPAGRHVTIVVTNGNAVINSNILYGSYATMADAPQFQLLVKNGSIRVAPTVTELHGAYVAEPGGTSGSGTLSTCYNGADTTDYTTCKSKLTFYGAVVAKTVLLERTYGNLNVSGATPADGAEVFQYTPELWAARNNPSGAGAQRYDSITSLPPIL